MIEQESNGPDSKNNDVLTTEELAGRWNLKKKTLEIWRIRGKGPRFISIGTGLRAPVRYRMEDVIEYEGIKPLRSTDDKKSLVLQQQKAGISKKGRRTHYRKKSGKR